MANCRPDLASQILLLDKAVFPRPKLCGGGVTGRAERFLQELDIPLRIDAMSVNSSRFVLKDGTAVKSRHEQFRVVAREEFDEYLFRCAQARGVATAEGEQILNLRREADHVQVTTDHTVYRVSAIVGCDGAKSEVRRLLKLPRRGASPVALEILVPVDAATTDEFTEHTAVFDFSSVAAANGAGYSWSFPSFRQDHALLNLGAAYLNPRNGLSQGIETKRIFAKWLLERGLVLSDYDLKGYPIPLFHPATPCSADRVIFAGDAIGIEPLFGEGISSALGTGIVAADTVLEALKYGDFSFKTYREHLRESSTGKTLRTRRIVARNFYRNPSFLELAAMLHVSRAKSLVKT